MADIEDWFVTDASNVDLYPEGMPPSEVNDSGRAAQGVMARWHADTDGSLLSTGAVNVFAVAANRTISAYTDGLTFVFEVATSNTGAATLSVDGLAAQNILWPNGTLLVSGDMAAQSKVMVRYDLGQTRWQLNTVVKRPQADLSVPSQAEAEAGTATNERVWTALRIAQAIAALETATTAQTLDKNYLTGCILRNDTDALHDINITGGEARNSDDTADLALSSEQTKRIDASWATGNDAGGLSSSLTVANNTWYHVHLVLISGTVEVGFDTSITAGNLVTDHSATKFRRIGSVLTDGSMNIIPFFQIGSFFYWDVMQQDVSDTSPGTDENTGTLSVPSGLSVLAYVRVELEDASPAAENSMLVTAKDQTNTPPSQTIFSVKTDASASGRKSTHMQVKTNTSKQIRYHVETDPGDVDVSINTVGWFDLRGKDG